MPKRERVDVTIVYDVDETGKRHAILVEPTKDNPRRKARSNAEIQLGIIQAIIEKTRGTIRTLSLRAHDNQHVTELAVGAAAQAFQEIEATFKQRQ